jgi:hypothetical protein
LCTVGNKHHQMQTSYYLRSKEDVGALLQSLSSDVGSHMFRNDHGHRVGLGSRRRRRSQIRMQ